MLHFKLVSKKNEYRIRLMLLEVEKPRIAGGKLWLSTATSICIPRTDY